MYTLTVKSGEYINDTVITSSIASIALFNCPSDLDPKIQDRVLYIAPFDGYARPNPMAGDISFPNLSCTVKPLITESTVQYTSTDQHFTILDAHPITGLGYRTPNETVDAIRQLYWLAISSWVCSPLYINFVITTSLLRNPRFLTRGESREI